MNTIQRPQALTPILIQHIPGVLNDNAINLNERVFCKVTFKSTKQYLGLKLGNSANSDFFSDGRGKFQLGEFGERNFRYRVAGKNGFDLFRVNFLMVKLEQGGSI